MTGQARPTVLIDNERVRVTEWRFAPGAATGPHRHDHAAVVIPMTTGRLQLVDGEGDSVIEEQATGRPYYREPGVEHDVVNPGDFEFVFIEVETK